MIKLIIGVLVFMIVVGGCMYEHLYASPQQYSADQINNHKNDRDTKEEREKVLDELIYKQEKQDAIDRNPLMSRYFNMNKRGYDDNGHRLYNYYADKDVFIDSATDQPVYDPVIENRLRREFGLPPQAK